MKKELLGIWLVCLLSFSSDIFAAKKMAIEYPIKETQGQIFYNKSFTSTVTGVTYPYHVYLPSGYSKQSDKRFPIIYATDAQWVFNKFVQDAEKSQAQIIIVGIEEGPRRSKRRRIDYTFPGVDRYLQFLSTEFFPNIESEFRVDSQNRTLQGASFGGLLALAVLFSKDNSPTMFRHILSFDPSVQYQTKHLQKRINEFATSGSSTQVNLLLTGAAKRGNNKAVMKFASWLKSKEIKGIKIEAISYDVNHGGISHASFSQALQKILK
ncbi:alpha/beta hydrolase [Paraglaciecola sp.]|uniref:alpha/beta hydrolase n=1 Tax=Paraglaciecola sp. TaxID=1920173 RepID=UPI003EF30F9B